MGVRFFSTVSVAVLEIFLPTKSISSEFRLGHDRRECGFADFCCFGRHLLKEDLLSKLCSNFKGYFCAE